MKNFLKEAFIMILFLLAIVLILGILLYNYIPTGKILPKKIAYHTPEEIKNEIVVADIKESDTSSINVVYRVDESELTMQRKTNGYKAGKTNPFDGLANNTIKNNTNEVRR